MHRTKFRASPYSAMIAIGHFSSETKEQAKTIKKLQAYYEYQIKGLQVYERFQNRILL